VIKGLGLKKKRQVPPLRREHGRPSNFEGGKKNITGHRDRWAPGKKGGGDGKGACWTASRKIGAERDEGKKKKGGWSATAGRGEGPWGCDKKEGLGTWSKVEWLEGHRGGKGGVRRCKPWRVWGNYTISLGRRKRNTIERRRTNGLGGGKKTNLAVKKKKKAR